MHNMSSSTDQLREELEQKIEKLEATHTYWLRWEAEYEACKEDIEELDDDATAEDMIEAGKEYTGNILDVEDMEKMVNYGKRPTRTKAQVMALLSNRAETGRRNAQALEQQISKANDALNQTFYDEYSEEPQSQRGGADIMEIVEELDDEGNIISSHIENFDERVGQMQKALEAQVDAKKAPPETKQSQDMPFRSKPAPEPAVPSIRITNDDEEIDSDSDSSNASRASHPLIAVSNPSSLRNLADNGAYAEAYDNMHEINPIVATMDIDEYSDSADEYNSDDEALENEYGMVNPRNELSEDYIKEMEALIRKHAMSNLGQETAMAVSKSSLVSGGAENSKAKKQKGVKFAEALDIAPEKANQSDNIVPVETSPEPLAATLSDLIVERATTQAAPPASTENLNPLSKFKVARLSKTTSSPAAAAVQLAEEPSFKEELALYKQRMNKPDQMLDRKLFNDNAKTAQGSTEEQSVGKMSRFKAARLGIRLED